MLENELVDVSKASLQKLHHHIFEIKSIQIDVLRLDKIHPVISGNKWFKLKYHLQQAIDEQKKGIITFGGAHSNHLIATAYACMQLGLSSIGIVRGEEPISYSSTLKQLKEYGMQLLFISREEYATNTALSQSMSYSHPDYFVVNDGGQGQLGISGAQEILTVIDTRPYNYIFCSVGTGTMITGIINSSTAQQKIVGISSLKIQNHEENDMIQWIRQNCNKSNFTILYDYHFGGYARKNGQLLDFMNKIYKEYNLPTDFVYTGKLLYAVMDLVHKNNFAPRDNILVIHSGGLQGNISLPKNALVF